MTLTVAQDATPRDDSHWSWSVWLEGTAAELNNVKEVVWRLHPTFSPSVYRVKSHASKFKLTASGWGEFMIYAEVATKDGKSIPLEHWLELRTSSGGAAPIKGAAPPPARDKKAGKPTVFLSYSLDNANVAAHVANTLAKSNYSVMRDIDIPPGEEVLRWSGEQIAKSDAYVLLGADEVGKSQDREIQIAKSAGIPVIPVTIGGSSKMAPSAKPGPQIVHVGGGTPQKIAANLFRQIGKLLP